MRAGIAFGSNLGNSLQLLRQARAIVQASALIARPFLASGIYLTSPMGCPPDAPEFLNAILEAELTGEPEALLRDLLACEQGLGRAERGERNAPRAIDLDLLYAGDLEMQVEGLILPHPRMTQRRFVLAPLAEIRPGLILPGQTETVAQLLARLPADDSAHLIDATW